MIARLNGTLAFAEANILVVDVNGVGYKVTVPVSTLSELGALGSSVLLHIHTHIREDELSLYGFSLHEQLKAFEILISVTGIGPKVALAILSSMDVATIAYAVSTGDTRTLVKIPGLGIKTAQRLALELKDKMAGLVVATQSASSSTKSSVAQSADQFETDIVDALVGLGYNRNDARRAADRVIRESEPGEQSSAKTLREALNVLTGNR